MKSNDQSDPAFPLPLGNEQIHSSVAGISTLDYFAGKALQGICATDPSVHFTNAKIAHQAYSLADAMMAERNARNKTPRQ